MNPESDSWKGLEVCRQAKETRWKLRFMELYTPTTRTYLPSAEEDERESNDRHYCTSCSSR